MTASTRISNFGFLLAIFYWLLPIGSCLLAISATPAFAQAQSELKPPPPLAPAEGRRVAQELIRNLLAQKPTANSTNTGALRIRDASRKQRQLPVQIEVLVTPTNFSTVYRSTSPGPLSMELTIVHAGDQPGEYLVRQPADAAQPRRLGPDQLTTPFGGSDFWAGDLGLEFLHWPQQRVLKKEMRKSVFCDVLESTNPKPVAGSYTRVVSWIGANHPDETVVVHADAFDAQNKLFKEFDPRKLEKVNGAWQLEEMELRNIQSGSRTFFQFDLTNE